MKKILKVRPMNRQEALQNLIFDSLQELREFVYRIELRNFKKGGEKKVCVIVFSNFFALQKWRGKETLILARMRELYKERNLKEMIVFHQVLAEMQGQNRFYKEQSSGKFKVLSHSPKIRVILERIKVAICENLERERR